MATTVTDGDARTAAGRPAIADDVLRRRLRAQLPPGGVRARRGVQRVTALAALYGATCAMGVIAAQGRSLAVAGAVWLTCWLVLALLLVSAGAIVHEAAHNHLTGRGWADALAGHVAGAFVFVPFALYRPYHLAHHVDTCGPGDSEGEPYAFSRRRWYVAAVVMGGWGFAAALTAAMVRTCLGRPPSYVRTAAQRQSVIDGALVWLAAVVVLVAGVMLAPTLTLLCWVAPVALVLSGPLSLLLLPEHAGADGAGPKSANTRTCRSNRLVRWVYLNSNFHTVHHVAPMIPWYELPYAHAVIEADIADGWNVSGYLAAHRAMWREIGGRSRGAASAAGRPDAPRPI